MDRKRGVAAWVRARWGSILLLAAAAVLFFAARAWAAPDSVQETAPDSGYAEYETGKVTAILSDNTYVDEVADGGCRGEQTLLVDVTSGRYTGETLQVYNYVGPLYNGPMKIGDSVVMIISTYQNGDHSATVYEYHRSPALGIVVGLFLLAAVLVGGRTGVKSLLGLAVTLAALFWVLIPMLMKGAPTLPTVFAICAYIAVVCLTIVGGLHRKTVCAMLGVIAGTALALLFGLLAQSLTRIDGLRVTDIEPLLQLRQTGESTIRLRGLLVGGIIISALGAVMDVAMGIASSLSEVHLANRDLGVRDLFRSGMNIGRDMVGTMSNTLILAFLGSSFTYIIFLYTLGLARHQLLSSAYVAIEVISGVASSVGVILSIPITALISAILLSEKGRK